MDWVAYFRQNRANRMVIPWEHGVGIEPELHALLVPSLQRFQMGERGDGSHLKKVVATTGDRAYMEAIALFVEEEQEHAALAARVLHGLGAPLLERHWSDGCFRLLCLMSGLRTELIVLLAAEIIAKRYFRAVYEGTGDSVVRAVCAQIRRDEEAHIAFHADRLRVAFATMPGMARQLVRAIWRFFFSVVCVVVLYDHHRALGALGVSPRMFLHDCRGIFDGVVMRVFSSGYSLGRVASE